MIKLFELSDVHLLNNRTPTEHILKSLSYLLPLNQQTADLDGIIFAGDLYDRSGSLADERIPLINRWFGKLFQFCAANDIFIRILEGTTIHDRHQPQTLVPIAELVEGLDFRYIDTVCVETIAKHNLTIGYVPDDWKTGPEDAWVDMQIAMRERGITQLDLAVMHGSFPHQLPPIAHAPHHDPERWSSIVKHFILIGHIHIQSQLDKILSAGSTDRIAHGEPRSKGGYRITIRENGENEVEFVENKNAWKYITINVKGLDLDSGMVAVRRGIADLHDGAYIQLKGDLTDPLIQGIGELRRQYPMYKWEYSVDTGSRKTQTQISPVTVFIPPAITRESVVLLAEQKIKALTDDPALISNTLTLLKELVRESQ